MKIVLKIITKNRCCNQGLSEWKLGEDHKDFFRQKYLPHDKLISATYNS